MGFILGIGEAADIYKTTNHVFTFAMMQGVLLGARLTIMLQGVCMMLAEIIPRAVPALDCPLIFPYAPNAVLIGFIVSMFTSTLALILIQITGVFPFVIFPLTMTCFFEKEQ